MFVWWGNVDCFLKWYRLGHCHIASQHIYISVFFHAKNIRLNVKFNIACLVAYFPFHFMMSLITLLRAISTPGGCFSKDEHTLSTFNIILIMLK